VGDTVSGTVTCAPPSSKSLSMSWILASSSMKMFCDTQITSHDTLARFSMKEMSAVDLLREGPSVFNSIQAYLRVAVGAAEEEVVERRVEHLLRADPPDHRLVAGAREGQVAQRDARCRCGEEPDLVHLCGAPRYKAKGSVG
jgi:hypothetical protein